MLNKLIRLCLASLIFVTCYPVLFLLTGSIMDGQELMDCFAPLISDEGGKCVSWTLFPTSLSFSAVRELFLFQHGFFRLFWNTCIITGGVLVGQLLVGVPASWYLAQYHFRYRRLVLFAYFLIMMIPFQALMLPEYVHFVKMHILNTMWSIILPGVFSVFPVFIEYIAFQRIPRGILEAARMDGADEASVLIHIGIPLGRSGIIAAMILQFLEYWNLIEPAAVFINDEQKWPMSLYLPTMSLDSIPIQFTATVLSMIPAVLLFLLTQSDLEEGIGAVAKQK